MWDWIVNLVRQFFFMLDRVIYSFIVTVYDLFVDIAETSIFTEEVIDLFASKVYALLGIFMLFKVSFSILSYIVSPDDFLDKTKGFSKMISNIIITLTLLIVTPWIFTQAMDIQRIILRDNIIGKIFSTAEINTNAITDPGNTMAYETFKAFYHLDTDTYSECQGLEQATAEQITGGSFDSCKSVGFNNADNFEAMAQSLRYAYNTNSISIYMDGDLLNQRANDDGYVMSYMYLISTLAGGAVCLLLIVFCFDIAVRSVKLGFLRMIAPIPIVSRVDPKKGKEVFDKWVKVCISTYLDLFIRLLAIYFAIFVITQMIDLRFVDAVTGLETEVNAFVKVFIILGALLFAKQLPKLIEDLTGLKMSGKFTLNPLKKLGETGVPGVAAVGAAALGSGIANFAGTKGNVFKKGLSALGGAGSALGRGAYSLAKNKDQKPYARFKDTMMRTTSARVDRDTRQEAGIGPLERVENYWDQLAGIKNKEGGYGKYNEMIKKYDREIERMSQDFRSKSMANSNYITQSGISASRADSIKAGIYRNMEDLFAHGNFDIRDQNGNVDAVKEQALDNEIRSRLASFTASFGPMSQNEATYLENIASEAKSSLGLAQLQKDRKDAAELTAKVNQASQSGKK